MIHALLSSLSNIADDALDEEETFSAKDLPLLKEEEPPNDLDNKEELAPDGHVDRDLDPILDHIKTESERPVNNEEQSLNPIDVSSQQDQNEKEVESSSILSPQLSETSLEHDKADSANDEHTLDKLETPEMPTSDPAVIPSHIAEDNDEILPAYPKLTRIFLTDLLKHADALYNAFPPSHSDLSLSSIMGPQSVIFTWSESPSYLPSDNTAEAMVSRPELVVYPFIEPDSKESSSSSSSSSRITSQHRKHRKHGKSPFSQMEKRTMVAGTVIVLGVAMAIYGVNVSRAGDRAGYNGIFHQLAEGHGHVNAKDWKRLGGWVGGAVAGATTKIIKGLSSQ